MVSTIGDGHAAAAHEAGDVATSTGNTGLPARVRWGRRSFLVLAWLFAACVIVQVFFAGLAIFVDSARWLWHTSFIHAFEFLPFLMLIVAFIARLPVAIRWLTGALYGLIFLQYFTANFGGLAGAFHPVNAFLLTWLSIDLARRTWRAMAGQRSVVSRES